MRIYKVHFSYTNMKFNVVLSISIGLVLLPRISKQEKPSDCIHLKQYWSTHFDESGSCILCPRSFEICSGQGEDRKSCEGSCFDKPTAPAPKPTSSNTQRSHSLSTSIRTKEDQKSTGRGMHSCFIVVVVLSCILIVFAGLLALGLWIRRSAKRDEPHRDEENRMALEPLRQNGDDGEQHVQLRNDVEERVHVPNDGEGPADVPNDVKEERVQAPSQVEGRNRLPNDTDEHIDVQHNVEGPIQESELPPTQPSPSGLIGGIQDENTGSSTLDVQVEIHN